MIKVGLVQISNSFSGQGYLPYSAGLLQAYAQKYLKDPGVFEFLPITWQRSQPDKIAATLASADIVAFSAYVWNMQVSLQIAGKLKEIKPQATVVFGGPEVPHEAEEFLRRNPFVDIACHGEGEEPFLALLENFTRREWKNVPSISYIDDKGKCFRNKSCARISELDRIPSPYLSGIFSSLMQQATGREWVALWETNRGCPFSCVFCYWGSAGHNKIFSYSIERLKQEIEWFAENKIEFVYCCDANFGILKRDIDIVDYMTAAKERYGYPKAFSVQNTKNITESSYLIQKKLSDSGLNKGVTLSVQSLNSNTLKSVKRDNISVDAFQKLQAKFTRDNIKTYTDVILGLPDETYESFTDGISSLIENGQHNRIQFNNLSSLTNTELNDPQYRDKYGLVLQEARIINIHGSLDNKSGVYEKQRLVVGTKTMPKEDWVKARAFSWMCALLHFDKLMQIPFVISNRAWSAGYKDMVLLFLRAGKEYPLLSEIAGFFTDKAGDIQSGGPEYCQSPEWLNIWWPADEFMFIRLCLENKLGDFYCQAEDLLCKYISKEKAAGFDQDLLKEAVSFNRNLIKLPGQYTDKYAQLSFNIPDVYRHALYQESVPVKRGAFCYRIDCTSRKWQNQQDWCREVVWYENKKGAYLYDFYPAESCVQA